MAPPRPMSTAATDARMSRFDPDDDDADGEWDDGSDETSDDGSEDDAADDTIPCPFCRRPIWDDSERCPHCGMEIGGEDAPVPRRPWWVIVTALILLLLFLRAILPW